MANAGHASKGEQLLIQAADAGAHARPAEQEQLLGELVKLYPSDPRARAQLGIVLFGRQDYDGAIRELSRAIELDPKFTLPYNQLGYAYRAQGKNAEAEKTFQKYAELLPDDPNPHDSYAELLMRMGRFHESITEYRKALQIDPLFLSAYVGIANDQMFMGKGDEARGTLKQMLAKARTDGEKRQAWFWTAETYMHEERWSDALRRPAGGEEDRRRLGRRPRRVPGRELHGEPSARRREAGRGGARSSTRACSSWPRPKVSDEVKDDARRNHLFNLARVALKKGDLAGARADSAKYAAAGRGEDDPLRACGNRTSWRG